MTHLRGFTSSPWIYRDRDRDIVTVSVWDLDGRFEIDFTEAQSSIIRGVPTTDNKGEQDSPETAPIIQSSLCLSSIPGPLDGFWLGVLVGTDTALR
jgi:hypothetical protein